MALTPDQILAAHKANLETLMGLTNKAFEGVEKLVELNVTASRAALTEAAQHTQAVLSVKDAQELLTLQAGLFQPLAEKTASYSRHLYDIASSTATEFNKAVEVQTTEARKNFNNLLETSAKNAQDLMSVQAGLLQPMAEKTAAYSRHLYDIASGTGAEFGKAFEGKVAEGQAQFAALVDNAAKNAPAGSESAVAVMKSAVAAANNAFESVQKAVKQASDVAEANLAAVTTSATNAAKSASAAAKKR